MSIQSENWCNRFMAKNSWCMKMFFPGGSTEKMKKTFSETVTLCSPGSKGSVCGGEGGELQGELLI